MSKKTKLLIAAGLLTGVGARAAVSAQGHRNHMHGAGGDFGEPGMGGPGFGGHGMGGFGGGFSGALTKDEFDARSRERFARLDKNNDGVIDATEAEVALTGQASMWQRMKGRMHGGEAGNRMGSMGARGGEQLLRIFDANKDGKVTKDEFLAGVRRRFAEMDLNNDGRISDEDLPPMMRGRNVLAGGNATGSMGHHGMPMLRMLQGADANKDGVITLDEVLAAADKRFALLDRNKDGNIDKADFDALRKEMVDYRVKRFIHHYGADKDGKITREQFMAKAAERFAQLDFNNDGTIGRDERPGGGHWFGRGHRDGPRSGGAPDANQTPMGGRSDGAPAAGPRHEPGKN